MTQVSAELSLLYYFVTRPRRLSFTKHREIILRPDEIYIMINPSSW